MCSHDSLSNGERKKEKMQFLVLAGSICRRQFVGVMIGLLDVKSFVEHDGEG